MEKELEKKLIELAKTNKRGLIKLKNACVVIGEFEFASKLRDIEREYFPVTEEQIKAKKRAEKLNLLFRMVELNIPEDKCWLIDKALEEYKKKKGKFSVEDGLELRKKHIDLFYKED
jgi:hypothetical protein